LGREILSMSILLDALKKSEAQRRLGQTPTLQTPVPGEFAMQNPASIWIPAAMSVVAGALIWWTVSAQYQKPETIAAASAGVAAPVEEGATASAPDPASGRQRSAKTPVMDFTETKAPLAGSADRSSAARDDSGQTPQSAVEPGQPEPGRYSEGAQVRAPESPSAAVRRAQRVAEADRVAAAERKREERLEPYEAESISYWQVPQSVRQDMPEMHITVLVYAENPSDRFLLVNGQRLHEHEELNEGLVLEEIKRDRAVFSYRNYRFHLKN
jgi:general secretion pathway protein B